jgi:hypothetical protein
MRRRTDRLLAAAAAITLVGCSFGPSAVWSVSSPNRSHRIELVEDGDRQWVAVDGKPGPVSSAIAPTSVVVSPDGGRLAYVEIDGEKARAVRDGCPGPWFDGVGELAFDASGEHFAYVAEKRGRFHVVCDGVLGAPRGGILESTLRFSPDGKHLFYVEGGPPFRLVIDEVAGRPFDGVARLSVRAGEAGASYAYLGRLGASTYVVTERGAAGPYQYISDITRDSASGSTAWVVDEGERAVVYRDGVAIDTRFLAVRQLAFVPGRNELAYVGDDRGGTMSVVHGDRTEGPYSDVSELSFSADGRRFGYAAQRDRTWQVVVDGRVGPRERFASSPVFSPDGTRMAHFVARGGRAHAVVDERLYPLQVAMVGTLAFSSDSRHFALIAGDRERRELFAFVDGRAGPRVEFSELTVATLKSLAGNAPPESELALMLDIARAEAERASGPRPGPRLSIRGCPR